MSTTGEAYGYTFRVTDCRWQVSCHGAVFAHGTATSSEAALKAALNAAQAEMEG